MQEKLFKSARAATTLDVNKMFNTVLADKGFQKYLITLNKLQLFVDNKDSNDNPLLYTKNGRTYTGYSQMYYELLGGTKVNGVSFNVGDPYTIANTGDFFNSFNLEISSDVFKINANPKKDDTNLFEAFGEDIMGWNDKNLQDIIDVIRKKFIQEVRQRITD